MAKYRVIHNVEIGGNYHRVGDVPGKPGETFPEVLLDETAFRPAEGDSPAEIDSLLGSGHIELVEP